MKKRFNFFLVLLIIILLLNVLGKKGHFDYVKFKNIIFHHTNFLKINSIYNGIYENTVEVSLNKMECIDYEYEDKGIIIYFEQEPISALSNGVVIYKNCSLNTVSLMDIDGIIYTYENLYNCDINLYEYVKCGDVIGLMNCKDNCYVLKLKIEKNGIDITKDKLDLVNSSAIDIL